MVWESLAKVRRRDLALAAMPKSISLMLSFASTMTFSGFRSRWTTPREWMYSNASRMRSVRCTARSGGSLRVFVEDLAEQAAVDPLHDHVDAAAIVVGEDFHHAGMVERLADFGFALEAVVEGGIALDFRVGNLYRDLAAVAQISGAKNGCHAAAGDEAFNSVMIELIAGMERVH